MGTVPFNWEEKMNKGLRVVSVFLGFATLLAALTVGGVAASYDLSVNVDLDEQTIQGYEDVTCTPAGDSLYFLLLANLNREQNPYGSERTIDASYPSGFEPSSTTIDSVETVQSGSSATVPFRLLSIPPAWQTYSLDKTVLAVDLSGDAPVTLRVHFTTHVPRMASGDQGIDRGILTWRFGWNPILLPPDQAWKEEDGTLLPPGDEFPLEIPAANYSARITVAADVTLVCGVDHSETIAPSTDETAKQVTYSVSNDTPTRTIAIAASKDYKRFSLDELAIPIEVYYLPGHDETARLFATYARDILKDYVEHYGPYPRARLTIVENPNRNGLSMAADGIVWLSDLFFTYRNVTLPGVLNRLSEFVLAHEIAHQWWGIGIGVDLNAENWLSEGMAQYLSITYFEEKYGEFGPNLFDTSGNGLLESFVASQFGFMNLREHQVELPYIEQVEHEFDEAIIKPQTDIKYDNATAVRLYDKGYLVARAIASAIGRDKFQQGLHDAAEQYMHKQITLADYQEVMEKEAGESLSALFDAWLRDETTVDYSVKILSRTRDGDKHETTVQVSRNGGVVQPVIVEVFMGQDETLRQEWDGKDDTATITFTTVDRVNRVTIDPDHLLPDRDRLNNNDPVKFVTITSTNAFPLDAYILHPDPASKGITLTYLDRIRLTLAEGKLSADIYQGRADHISLSATLSGSDLGGMVGYAHVIFSSIPTGSAGTFFAPTGIITISGHRIISSQGPVQYLHLGIASLPTMNYSRQTQVGIDLTAQGAGRITLAVADEVRIFPRIYMQGTAIMGAGFGALPDPLLFDLTELMSFGRMSQGKWVPSHAYGTRKLYGRLAIELPNDESTPYNLANVMMVDRARTRVFIAAGTSWTSLDEFGKTSPYVEAGVEEALDLSAIGGLLPFRALVGYAVPILGEGTGVFYFGFSL